MRNNIVFRCQAGGCFEHSVEVTRAEAHGTGKLGQGWWRLALLDQATSLGHESRVLRVLGRTIWFTALASSKAGCLGRLQRVMQAYVFRVGASGRTGGATIDPRCPHRIPELT